MLHHLGLGDSPLSLLRDGIVWELRLPRVLTAAAVGAGLAVSGAVMQALTRNPLADPYLLGLSSGASLGAVAVLLLGAAVLLPVAAFLGAMLALGMTLLLASSLGRITPSRTVLAGFAVSALASAVDEPHHLLDRDRRLLPRDPRLAARLARRRALARRGHRDSPRWSSPASRSC